MEVTFKDFCERVKKDTEKTTSKADQYRAAVKYFYELHVVGAIVYFNETFTAFQNGVLHFLNEKFEKQTGFFVKDLKVLLSDSYSDFKYGYSYARKVSQA